MALKEGATNYKITCDECGGHSDISIRNMNNQVIWREIGTIISARLRLDGNWGFQCKCGNNDIMTEQEVRVIENIAQPKPQEIEDIKKNLEVQNMFFTLKEK